MTVTELIEKLKTFPSDTLVIVASDPEGNSFDTLGAVDSGKYDGYELAEDGRDVVVLWP